jgi:hypothetical protein
MVIGGVYKDFKKTKSHLNGMAVRQPNSHDLAKKKHKPGEKIQEGEDN